MSDILSPLIMQLGLGGLGGFFVGYLLKKVLKFAIIIGVLAFILVFFVYESSIQINYSQLITKIGDYATPIWAIISPIVSQIPALGSLAVGVVLGFTKS